jgi:hypothetical protein
MLSGTDAIEHARSIREGDLPHILLDMVSISSALGIVDVY